MLNVPTPQRTPTLDALVRRGAALVALYLDPADVHRGWGAIDIEHPHAVLDRRRIRRAREIIRRISDEGTRVVCVFGYSRWEHVLAFATSRLLHKEVVTRSDSNIKHLLAQSRLRRHAKRAFLRLVIGSSTTIWTIGSANVAYWKALGFRNLVSIPYQVPQMPGGSAGGALELRSQAGATGTTPIFLFVGRLVPTIKGIEDLVNAYRTATEHSDLRAQLWIVGDGPLNEELRRSCWDLPDVKFRGACEYGILGNYYMAADCVVVPSRREPWGLVVNEALGLGRYVIASDKVAAADELVTPSNGVRYEGGDKQQLANALIEYARVRPSSPPPLIQQDTAALMAQDLRRLMPT